MDSPTPTPADVTVDHPPSSLPLALQQGIALAHSAQETGDSVPLVRWLAQHPELARDLAEFLAGERVFADLQPRRVAPTIDSIDHYELGEELGRGGMGVVRCAMDTVLKREVAVKLVLTGSKPSSEELAAFRREAELAASLDHPNIVRVLHFNVTDGIPYLVMPLMQGGTLAQRLKTLGPDRCLKPKVAAHLVRDIALAVHHAHQRLLLHRDLKPGNILLDADGKPHVADFGLARPLDVSMTGGVAGTAAYMAPEQARGEKKLTTAADIHALGAILFELLKGTPPFGTGDIGPVMHRVINDIAPPLRNLRPDLPRDLEIVCWKCLEKDPADRYPSAQALADDLNRYLEGTPIEQQSRTLMASISRALRRRIETSGMQNWPIAFWGAGWSLLLVGAMQSAVLLGADAWLILSILGTYFVGWITIVWYFLIARRDVLNQVERGSMALHVGMFFAYVSIVCTQLWMNDGDVLTIFPPLGAVLGLMVFVHGLHYWGRLYVIGMLAIAVSAATPLVPKTFWPSVYGLTVTACQAWAGVVLLSYHRKARADANDWRIAAAPPPP